MNTRALYQKGSGMYPDSYRPTLGDPESPTNVRTSLGQEDDHLAGPTGSCPDVRFEHVERTSALRRYQQAALERR